MQRPGLLGAKLCEIPGTSEGGKQSMCSSSATTRARTDEDENQEHEAPGSISGPTLQSSNCWTNIVIVLSFASV